MLDMKCLVRRQPLRKTSVDGMKGAIVHRKFQFRDERPSVPVGLVAVYSFLKCPHLDTGISLETHPRRINVKRTLSLHGLLLRCR